MSVSKIAAIAAINALEKVRYDVNMRLLDKTLDQARSAAGQLLKMLPEPPEAPHPELGRHIDLLA